MEEQHKRKRAADERAAWQAIAARQRVVKVKITPFGGAAVAQGAQQPEMITILTDSDSDDDAAAKDKEGMDGGGSGSGVGADCGVGPDSGVGADGQTAVRVLDLAR